MKLFPKQLHKKQTGFTMMELLMVIAIIVILIGVAVPAVGYLRRNLRQRELDSKAEVIYTAAQSRLTQLRTGGYAELYGGVATDAMPDISKADPGATVRGIDGLHRDILPTDAINDNGEAENLCYVVSEENENIAYVILPEESVDKDLWNNHWVIEFDPEVGNVYAVFYGTESILDRTGNAATITNELNNLRNKPQRLEDGARVGYYGGDLTQANIVDKDSMNAVLKIINKEELILDMTCYTAEKPSFTVTIQDSAGNTYTKTIEPGTVQQPSAGQFHATWTLDSLKNGGSFYDQTEGKLLCGTDITVTLNTSRPWEPGVDLKDSASATTNSLYAWRGDYGNDANTAYIAYGRHLQNLDNLTSHVQNEVKGITSNVSKAVQVQDVSFQKSAKEDSYYVTYGDRLFDPIHNDRIVSYVGQKIGTTGVPAISGLHIESSEPNVGLFTTFAGLFQDLRITGPKIQGGVSNVGTLMGAVSGGRATTINNVQVFLSDSNGDLDNQQAGTAEEVNPWLTGRNVGGLIGSAGSNSLTIANSSASLPLEADRYAGGLVGMLNCTARIYNSYADGYLRGTYVGGLIGGAGQRGNITLQNFYAAGYAVAKETAAGLVVFDDSYNPLKITSNGYSVMNLEKAKNSEDVKFYAMAPRCDNMQKTYYLPQQGITYQLSNTPGAEALSYEVLSSDQAFSYEQTVDGKKETVLRLIAPFKSRMDTSNVTHPYNLLSQGLTSYTYPKLSTMDNADLAHYGDWKAEFEEGSLVYFERDELGRYRFEGGNISVDQIQADTSENDYTKRPKIVADGYALAYRSDKGTEWDGKAKFGGNTVKLVEQQTMNVAGYVLYRLPASFLNNDEALKKSTTFYQTLEVSETEKDDENRDVTVTKTYYFNPNFASCISSSASAGPEILRIRSPRQLYALSRLHEAEAKFFTANTVIRQEMDLDYSIYEWSNAYNSKVDAVSTQEPIGSDTRAFVVTYDGRNNTIQGLGIATKGNQVGLFGKVESSGTVQNLVLLGEKDGTRKYLAHNATDARPELSVADGIKTVNIGALVGWNKGTVANCAVTGFNIELAAYNGVTVNIGGLVGRNEGGSISNSSAETPEISIRNYSSNTYAAGFVGNNSGTVYNSYAAGYLEVKEAKLETGKYTSRIAGFAARNDNGNLLRCYAGTPLMGSGDTEMFGFTASGGSVLRSYYLDGGTYEYRGQIYSLNASENGQRGQAGRTTSADDLEAMVSTLNGYGKVDGTYLGNENKDYPYPEAVTRNGQYMHFGQWPNQDKDIGTFGVFYWEYEQGGNSGYHLTFQGTADGAPMQGGSTLCTAHDDGGVITKYGYGYFYKPVANDPNAGEPHLEVENCVLGDEDTEASQELQRQMPQYRFVAYKTGVNGLRMTGTDANRDKEANRNAVWKLYYPYKTTTTGTGTNTKVTVDETASGVYTYSVSPFFGDAYNLVGISKAEEKDIQEVNNGSTAGSAARNYQVRNVDQLQFINWNYYREDVVSAVSAKDAEGERLKRYCTYPYLSYGTRNSWQGKTVRIPEALYWKQTHDVDGTGRSGYAPIGSMYDDARGDRDARDANVTLAYFSSTYDGQAYVIKNISITSSEQCVGIFGATSGAKMKNVVLYSDNNSEIVHSKDAQSWYAVGGLVGLAGAPTGVETVFTNCTVSAYTIVDYQSSNPGWGGGCIGGLVGVCTVDLTNCTAVTDIDIRIGYVSPWQNLRVGGLVGCARAEINACYAGGSMADNSGGTFNARDKATRIWIGGIVGGNVLRDGDPKKQGNLSTLIGDTSRVTTVKNCYSFVNVPSKGASGQKNRIHSSMAIASNSEMLDVCDNVTNDYIEIYNCYALDSTAKNGDDYKQLIDLKKNGNFYNINLNNILPSRTDRRVQMYNRNNPIVTYAEMRTILMDQLNSGITGSIATFAPVTTTENAASINGKYSFPGGDSQLVGLDYPFPTILTQTDVDGNTVHVHYGAWPKFGIYWEEHKVTMDLLALRNTTGVNLLALYGDQEAPIETEEPEDTGQGVTEPEETVPETTVPEETVPETTVPETTVPETTVPETTVPETTAPEGTVSEDVALAETEPEAEETQPASAEPAEGEEEPATLAAAFQALDADTIQAIQTYNLYVVGIDTTGIGTPTYELQDETGTPIEAADESKAAARILVPGTTLVGGDHYEVTFLAQHPGTVRVLATVNQGGTDYTALLTITVTADLRIKVEESKLPMKTYVGDPMEDAMVTLEDSKGTQFKPGDGATLTWTLGIDSQESEQDLVTWTANGFIVEREESVSGGGTEKVNYLTSLKGFSSGEGSLKLSLTYTWDDSADPVETSVIIPIEVYPSDVLGLGDGVISQEVEIPHSNPASATGTARTDEENIPTLDGTSLFLYASNETDADGNLVSYTDLSKFQITKAELKRTGYGYQEMTKVVPGEDDSEPTTDDFTFKVDEDHTVTFKVDKDVVSAGDRNQSFTYRPITVEGDIAEQWTLRLTLQPVDENGALINRTYVLEYDRPNTVTFAYRAGETDTVLKTYRVDQGQDLSDLDQDTLDEELEEIAQEKRLNLPTTEGHHYTWVLPEDAINANRTIIQESVPIRYYVAYDAGYEDYEWDDNVPMERDTFTYGEEVKHLKANEYNRPGYVFAGWSATIGGEKTYGDKAEFIDRTGVTGEDGQPIEDIFTASVTPREHNAIITLYAVWEPKEYTITYNGNFSGWNADGMTTMDPDTYSIGSTGGTVKDTTFVRDGYTFLGWAFDAAKAEPDILPGDSLETAMHQGGEYVVYSDVTLYAVWQQNATDQVTDTLEPPEEPEVPEETEAPEEPEKPVEEPTEEPEAPIEPTTEATEAPTEPEPVEETEPPEEPTQEPEKAPEEAGDSKEKNEPEEE